MGLINNIEKASKFFGHDKKSVIWCWHDMCQAICVITYQQRFNSLYTNS
jgi:hypothetical protein